MSLDSDLQAGFQVKYLGSIAFTRKKRQPLKGIVSLQRPLLDLYTEARRRGESNRSVHPLALTQQLEICDYGLVVAEGTNRGETVITKVITPLSNVVLWAAVRFHARITKKRVFGAAFVPLACSDGVLDHKSYVCLNSRQRFLVSLTHPSVFACIYRSVSAPATYECHAFVCATAEDAISVAALATLAAQAGSEGRQLFLAAPATRRPRRRRPGGSVDSGTDYYTPSDATPERYGSNFNGPARTDTEEESNSYASVANKALSSPSLGGRRRYHSPRYISRPPRKRFTNHREARALIGRVGVPGRPLPEDEEMWRTMQQRREQEQVQQERYELSEPDRVPTIPLPNNTTRYKTTSTMTENNNNNNNNNNGNLERLSPPPTEVLAETIDLSSESAASSGSSGGWRPLLPANKPASPQPLVKYTYFGYETYAKPLGRQEDIGKTSARHRDGGGNVMVEQRRPKSRGQKSGGSSQCSGGIIKGNGTGKVIITVPPSNSHPRPDSRNSSAASSSVLPRGVRTFRKNGHVRDWSSLSHASSSSSLYHEQGLTMPDLSSSSREGRRPHPGSASSSSQQQHKVIRWSSEDRLQRRTSGGFFLSLKRLSIQSLTKAKHKTGKFITNMKTRIMGTKRSSADGSSDSAYDTSEVCLSPTGRHQTSASPGRQARRQQSWSFHDLRTSDKKKPVVPVATRRRKHHRRRRKDEVGSSSSDSGVEAAAYQSGGSDSGRKSSSDPGRLATSGGGVTRVTVRHGMGEGTFQRWSHTNIQDELGYIP
ncbi:hypothetical protein JTE90_004920 [Oedothorax gibbosus]|uniref:PID domain-containing protein n=1 Tax=Oedothorax gibbosus TaxID=931172 RepID=A0AAV6UK87_9ARAC|nr:hypothetical protein JTE90_004920 [Oedothorax gibbosus]